MSSKVFLSLISIWFAILFFACINEIGLEELPIQEVPVLSCVLRPYQPVHVYLNSTIPVSMESKKDFSAATVLLYEENQLIDTLEYTGEHWFESELNAIPGYSYEILAWIDGRLVRGGDRLPLQNNILEVTEDLVESHNGSNDLFKNYGVKFTQDDMLEEYFEISHLGVVCMDGTCSTGFSLIGPNQDPIIVAEGILEFKPNFLIFSDKLLKDIEVNVFTQYIDTGANGAQQLVGQKLMSGRFIRFSSISKEAYLFKKSLLRYHANINTDDRLNDLKALFFGSEPSNLYSNIEGGKGMVMGVNEQYIPIKF